VSIEHEATNNYKKRYQALHAWPTCRYERREDSIEQCKNTILFPKTTQIPLRTQPLLLRHELPSIVKSSFVRDLDWRKDVKNLQEVGNETEKTDEGSTRDGDGLVGTGSGDWGWDGRWDRGGDCNQAGSGSDDDASWGGDWGGSWSGAVEEDWGRGWDSTETH
jgi:hypothetical protein